jgi:hypothetical protein
VTGVTPRHGPVTVPGGAARTVLRSDGARARSQEPGPVGALGQRVKPS